MKKTTLILAAGLSFLTASSQTLSDSLKAHYTFSGNTDDVSGNNLHLTNNGATLASDRHGNPNSAYYVTGATFLELEDASALVSNAFSISIWVKIVTLPITTDQGSIVSFGDVDLDHGINITNRYMGTYDGFTVYSYTDPNTNVNAYDNVGANANTWYHLVLTRDNNKITMYKNGVFAAESSANAATPGFGSGPITMLIGKRMTDNMFYNGIVDDLRIYTRVLSANEVAAIYSPATSIETESATSASVIIYPNPSVNNQFIVEGDQEVSAVEITDMQGKTVYAHSLPFTRKAIDMEEFPKGLYIITTTVNNQHITQRIILQ